MGCLMKSKVRIDDEFMAELGSRARVEQKSVTRTLNRVIQAGLVVSNRPSEERERYEEVAERIGRPLVEIGKALALAAAIEDKEIIRKMSSCLLDNQWLCIDRTPYGSHLFTEN